MNDEEKKLQIDILNQYHSEFFCSECYANPKYTAFDKDSFVGYCIHKRAGFLLRLIDFKPEGPAHIMFPISQPEFIAAVVLMSAIAQAMEKQKQDQDETADKKMEAILADIPDDKLSKA